MQLTPEYSVFFIDTNPKTDRMYDVFKATGKVIRHAYLVTNKPVQDGENILQFDVDVLPELTPLFTVVLFQYISATVTIEKNNFKCHPFFEKFEKKGVDKWGEGLVILTNAVREMRGAGRQKLEEIQKAVDKRKTVCYNLKVVADKRQPSERKKLKKLLDRRSRV